MSQFELFVLFYYYLEAKNQTACNKEVSDFLKKANPFLFTDYCSTDKRVFTEFGLIIGQSPVIEADYGYYLILKYLKKKNMPVLSDMFSEITMNEWKETAKVYLSHPHKGGSL